MFPKIKQLMGQWVLSWQGLLEESYKDLYCCVPWDQPLSSLINLKSELYLAVRQLDAADALPHCFVCNRRTAIISLVRFPDYQLKMEGNCIWLSSLSKSIQLGCDLPAIGMHRVNGFHIVRGKLLARRDDSQIILPIVIFLAKDSPCTSVGLPALSPPYRK